jgi:hypothetical protein
VSDSMQFNAVTSASVDAPPAREVFARSVTGADLITPKLISFGIKAPIVIMTVLIAQGTPRTSSG